jgi:hypothetical protein
MTLLRQYLYFFTSKASVFVLLRQYLYFGTSTGGALL